MTKINVTESKEIIDRIVKLTKKEQEQEFNKRDAGINLKTFLIVFTVTICFMKTITLEGLANKCKDIQYGLSMTKQSLHKRLEAGSKQLKELLGETIKVTIEKRVAKPQVAMVLEQFKSVLITDSTTLSLPDKLEGDHKGLGGTNAKSAMKIQATYDIKNKDFRKIEIIDNATKSDGSYVEELIREIAANELVIFDLGYYGVTGFQEIGKKGAYFLSKIKSNTKIYRSDKKAERIDLMKEFKDKERIDKEVIIKGAQGKWMKVRLVGVKLPEVTYNERLRKSKKAARASGRTLSAEELERLKWILIVTNIENDILDAEALCELYRIRWQIELIFKTWKSYFAIDEMNNIGKDYLDCLIFGKLVVITLMTCLYSHLFYQIYELNGRLLSYMRFMKNIREELGTFIVYFTKNQNTNQLSLAINRVIASSLVEKRKRKTSEQSIASFDLPQEVLEMLH